MKRLPRGKTHVLPDERICLLFLSALVALSDVPKTKSCVNFFYWGLRIESSGRAFRVTNYLGIFHVFRLVSTFQTTLFVTNCE